jgi:GT2 family glycosyltransferase
MSSTGVRLSIIVPAYNSRSDLQECLSAVLAAAPANSEFIVVDDGSTEQMSVPNAPGVRLLRLPKNAGPSSARNYGARHAKGDILLFVDSDVIIAPDAVQRMLAVFEKDSTVAAVFGSYDNRPRAKGLVSQFRNLLHHYVHQTGSPEASTFWGGCGAMRRSVFEEVGGFDEQRFTRFMEDVELGYRVRLAGHRIVLDRTIQGTHLKRWTLRSMIRTDTVGRAVPWTRLILERKQMPSDLNLKASQRASVALVAIALAALFMAAVMPRIALGALVLAVAAVSAIVVLNRDLYRFFLRERGLLFVLGAIPLHLLYFAYSGVTFVIVWCDYQLNKAYAQRAFGERAASTHKATRL